MEMQITQAPTGPDAPAVEPPKSVPAPATAGISPAPAGVPAGERPAWLPEGFDTPEALAAAYAELKNPKQPGADPKAPKTDDKAQDKPAAGTDEAVSRFVQDTGLDPVALSREIASSGDINAEAKAALSAKLEKAGLPASMVNEYISGQKAVQDAAVRDVMSVAGGEEGFHAMADWARDNLSDAELAAFSNIMLTADINTAKLTVGNLYARYKGTAAISGSRLRGVTGVNSGDIFQSWEQQLAAQRDPRYTRDPAFREEFERKIARTMKAGGYSKRPR